MSAVEKFLEESGQRLRAIMDDIRAEAAALVPLAEQLSAAERRLRAEENRFRNDDWSGGGDPWLVHQARAVVDAARAAENFVVDLDEERKIRAFERL